MLNNLMIDFEYEDQAIDWDYYDEDITEAEDLGLTASLVQPITEER